MPNDITINISANYVAWYGAILATISFVATFFLSLFDYLRNSKRMKIKVSVGLLVREGGILDENTQILVEGVNKGRRPITINGVGFALNKSKSNLIMPNPLTMPLPYELHEGKSCTAPFDLKEIKDSLAKYNAKIKFAWIRDATGKVYKKRFKLKLLK